MRLTFPEHSPRRSTIGLLTLLCLTLGPTIAFAQQLPGTLPKPAAKKPAEKNQSTGRRAKVTIPEPETIVLETKDKVKLVCSYFAPPQNDEEPEAGKMTIPFIVVHDWKGSRRDTYRFGKFLQSQGHAVLVPALRGHGSSTEVIGLKKPVSYESFNRQQMAMLINDIEQCKRFLVKRNNEGSVNIDLLSLVAVGEMAPIAATWAVNDWYAFPPFNSKGIKQGQDVKSLVLFGPRRKFANYDLRKVIQSPLFAAAPGGTELPIMLVWGTEEEKSNKDSKSVAALLEKLRPEPKNPPRTSDPAAPAKPKSFFKVDLEGSGLTGTELIASQRVKGLWAYIGNTIKSRVKSDPEKTPWTNRNPDEN